MVERTSTPCGSFCVISHKKEETGQKNFTVVYERGRYANDQERANDSAEATEIPACSISLTSANTAGPYHHLPPPYHYLYHHPTTSLPPTSPVSNKEALHLSRLIKVFVVRLQNQWVLWHMSTNKECPAQTAPMRTLIWMGLKDPFPNLHINWGQILRRHILVQSKASRLLKCLFKGRTLLTETPWRKFYDTVKDHFNVHRQVIKNTPVYSEEYYFNKDNVLNTSISLGKV